MRNEADATSDLVSATPTPCDIEAVIAPYLLDDATDAHQVREQLRKARRPLPAPGSD